MNSAEVLIKFTADTAEADKATQEVSTSLSKLTKAFTLGSLASKGISKGISILTSNLDNAIKRVDTLNNFPKVMDNLGISAKESEEVINDLSEKLIGLPTSIDQAALSVQRLTSKNGDIKKSEQLYLALNNALLAGGASTEIQATAMEQLSQAYAKGKPDMMEWRSIQTAMPAQLKQVAKAMGYVDAAALGMAIREDGGEKEFSRMMDTMMRMNTEGVSGFKSFEEQAKNSTGGIQTNIKNMRTAFVRGIADMIKNIDKSLEAFGGLKGVINSVGKVMEQVFKTIGNILGKAIAKFIEFARWVNKNKAIVKTFVVVLGSMYAAIKVLKVISTITTLIAGFRTAITMLQITALKCGTSMTSLQAAIKLLNINPTTIAITAAVGAVAGLVAGIKLLSGGESAWVTEHKKTMDELKKAREEIDKQKQSWKELQDQKQEQIDLNMTQVAHEQSLYDELKNITDANGKVKEGYEERAKFITGELSKAYGVEIEMQNGVIKNYKKIQEEIDKAMEKKKAEIILKASEEAYTEAIKNQAKAQRQANKLKEKAFEANKKYEEASEEYAKKGTLRSYEQMTLYRGEASTAIKSYQEQQDMADKYYYEVGQYMQNYEHFQKGEYDKMKNNDWDYVKNFQATGDAEKAQLEANIQNTQATLDRLKKLKEKSGTDIYDQQIRDGEKQLTEYKKQLGAYITTTGNGLQEASNKWAVGLSNQLKLATGKQVDFKNAGNGLVQAYINGQKVGKPMAESEAKKIGNDVVKKYNKYGDTYSAGKDLINGFANGMSNTTALNNAIAKADGFAKKILTRLRNKLDIHSPSRITTGMGINLLKGFSTGIDDEENALYNRVNKFSNGLIKNIDIGNIPPISLNNSTIATMNNSQGKQIVNVYASFKQDSLGQTVRDIKTFSGGARNDYNYGVGV